ncbi:MAG: tol-pal system protein YbgF [Candidatus Acidiferrales bacterium]
MRIRWIVLALTALIFGALGGAILAPSPAGAVSREIIQLQQQVGQILQAQTDLRSTVDSNNATMRTLVQQSLDSINSLNSSMGSLQKTVQEVQANSGSRIDTLTTQTQGLSDNLQDVQARVGKLSQQLTDMQGLLQSIDAKVSGGAPPVAASPSGGAPATNAPSSAAPPMSSDTLYQNALRDYTSGKYDLSRQEFSDYLRYFPATDLASNAQFYLGEISYVQGDYQGASAEYDKVIVNYPKSYKLAAALLKKGESFEKLGQKASAVRQYHELERRFPGTDEARRAQARLKVLAPAPAAPPH